MSKFHIIKIVIKGVFTITRVKNSRYKMVYSLKKVSEIVFLVCLDLLKC